MPLQGPFPAKVTVSSNEDAEIILAALTFYRYHYPAHHPPERSTALARICAQVICDCGDD